MPRHYGRLLVEVEAALATDNGFVGEGMDLSQGPPEQLGTRGLYGDHGPFNVIVNPGAGNTEIVVSASSQVRVTQSEAIAALGERVAAKDEPGNEILLITCGLIDERGYTCPADQIIFQFLREISASGVSIFPDRPEHIKGILMHLWNSPYMSHWQTTNDVPWLT